MNTNNGNSLTRLKMKSLLIVLTILSAVVGFYGPADAAIPTAERNALIDLYTGTSVSGWTNSTNWNGAAGTECTWYGVYCDAGKNHVTIIDLSSNNLVGTIPASIGNLSSLTQFWLRFNSLSGALPAELGNLSNLQILNLSGNQLTGSLPAQLGSMTSLQQLTLYNNMLSGSIPTQLGSLSNLQTIDLQNNQLAGSIPAEFGNLSALTELFLNSNQLIGAIPVQLGNLANLQYLILSSNQLTGAIPPQLGNLANLRYLYLQYNQLSGAIPAQVGNLTNLSDLSLYRNQLTGSIPVEFGNLLNLRSLWLGGNQLAGPVPAQLMNLVNLQAGNSEFRWNALYTTDAALKSFLDSKQPGNDWVSTQTIGPTNHVVSGSTATSVTLSWTAIPYIADTGGYEVYYSSTSGGSYTLFETTASKSATGSIVTGLLSGSTYYFKVRTKTNSHANNPNIVYSEYTSEVSSQTIGPNIQIHDSLAPQSDLMMPFGSITQGNTSDQTVTVTNIGNRDLVIGTIASANPLAAPFSITSDTCSGQTIAPAGTCTLTVRFSPAVIGSFSDSFDIPSNDPDTPSAAMSVAGTGAIPVPDIAVTDNISPDNDLQMPFGNVTEGVSSPAKSVTISNAGTADLVVSRIQLSGADTDQFSMDVNGGSSPCASTTPTVAAGKNCTITVTFRPSSIGAKTAAIAVASNDPDEATVNISLSGTGLSASTNNAPTATTLVFPANGQTGLGTTVDFRWKKTSDPDNDAVTYHLSYCTDQNFTNCTPVDAALATGSSQGTAYYAGFGWTGLLLIGLVFAGGVKEKKRLTVLLLIAVILTGGVLASCGGSGDSATPSDEMTYSSSGLNSGATYYWKVVADDGKGGTTTSAVWSFTTQ